MQGFVDRWAGRFWLLLFMLFLVLIRCSVPFAVISILVALLNFLKFWEEILGVDGMNDFLIFDGLLMIMLILPMNFLSVL